MFLRVLAPRRASPTPVAGPMLSLTAHAALVVAAAGGGAPATAGERPADRDGGAAGERLQWVGVSPGSGPGTARRPGGPPPTAYIIPGRGPARAYDARTDGPLARRAERAPGRGRGGHGDGTETRRSARVAAERPLVNPLRAEARRRRAGLHRLPLPALPDVALPDPSATLLVGGVVSAMPELVRRVARPEEFAPPAASALLAEVLVRSGTTATGPARADLHARALPVPFVNNPPPSYPAALERARVNGRVVVEFLVDTAGTVDMRSFRVVQSTDAMFTDAVRGVLPRLRFVPALRGDQAVGVVVRQPFLFTMRR